MKFYRIAAKIRFISIYECSVCGVQHPGSNDETTFIDCQTPEQLKEMLEHISQKPHAMPIGWASFTDGIRCPKHKGN